MNAKINLKQGFALATALVMVIGMSVNASAAEISTLTTYNASNPDMVDVESTVTNVNDGTQVTYLAYDKSDTSGPQTIYDGNIVFIDQKEAGKDDPTTTCKFKFTTDIDLIGSTLVKFGSSDADATTTETNEINTSEVTVNITGEGTVTPGVGAIKVLNNISKDFNITPTSGYKISNITFGGTNVTPSGIIDGAGYVYTASNITGAKTLAVTFSKIVTDTNKISRGGRFGSQMTLNGGKDNKIATFSTVTISSSTPTTDCDYGIIFYHNPADLSPFKTQLANGEGFGLNVFGGTATGENNVIKKYKALGKSDDGKYAVRLIDGGSGYLNGKTGYYTMPYMIIKVDNTYITQYGDQVEFGH